MLTNRVITPVTVVHISPSFQYPITIASPPGGEPHPLYNRLAHYALSLSPYSDVSLVAFLTTMMDPPLKPRPRTTPERVQTACRVDICPEMEGLQPPHHWSEYNRRLLSNVCLVVAPGPPSGNANISVRISVICCSRAGGADQRSPVAAA